MWTKDEIDKVLKFYADAPRMNKPLSGLGSQPFSGGPFNKSVWTQPKSAAQLKADIKRATYDYDFWLENFANVDEDTVSTQPTITFTSFEIQIVGDWEDRSLLHGIKTVEKQTGIQATWTGASYTFPLQAQHTIELIFKDHAQFIGVDEALGIHKVFVDYLGACRSHGVGSQQMSVGCTACLGRGIIRAPHQMRTMNIMQDCPTCNGSGRMVTSATTVSYASGWSNGGWTVRFPEDVLKAYFGVPEKPFDGDFYRALLEAPDISKRYKQLARSFHPDMRSGSAQMFQKLADAYQALKDPQLRKRYEAGLKFQQQTKQIEQEVVYRAPLSCGDAVLRGTWQESGYRGSSKYGGAGIRDVLRRLDVTEIISFNERVREDGMVMTARWAKDTVALNPGERPFVVEWESKYQVEFDVKV